MGKDKDPTGSFGILTEEEAEAARKAIKEFREKFNFRSDRLGEDL